MVVMLACAITPSHSQETAEGPNNEKAQKTYEKLLSIGNGADDDAALDSFKKADKQDGGHLQIAEKTAQ